MGAKTSPETLAKKPEPPSAAQIKTARIEAGLTQTQAAELIHSTLRTWQEWESGKNKMHIAMFEYFKIRTNSTQK